MEINKNFTKLLIIGTVILIIFMNGVSASNISLDLSNEADWIQENAAMIDITEGVGKLRITGYQATVLDANSNTYNTVVIGSQLWMATNMRTNKYPDGSSISRGPTGATWDKTDHGYYACPPNTNNNAEDCDAVSTLGYVYQWSAAMKGSVTAGAQGICPSGWHIPTHNEYTTLEREVCDSETCATDFPYDTTTTSWRGTNEGLKLKSGGTSGFEGLFTGYRNWDGVFYGRGTYADIWSSSESGTNDAWRRRLLNGLPLVYRMPTVKPVAFSVRCLKNSFIPYSTAQPYYITTATGSQINTSTWAGINNISLTQTTPTDTSLKYLVSFDNRITWKYWSGSAWIVSSLANLQTEGMDKTTLEAITESQWSSGFIEGTLDFAIDLKTTDSSNTPELNGISINYFVAQPIYSNFIDSETTNFSDSEINLSSVLNLILKRAGQGKIKFGQYGINAKGTNFDNHVKIEDSVISVNTSALHPSFNNSATLTFYNVNCNAPYVYYSETKTTRLAILAEDTLCPSWICSNIQCLEGTLTVDVTHFSGYAVNGTANLTIDADDPKFPLELVTFTAEYRNATSLITGATCIISLPDGDHIMNELASDRYNYSTTFASAQTVDYNVTCNKTGESTVFANDTAVIQSVDIPEFSIMTLTFGFIAILAGLFIIRKKR